MALDEPALAAQGPRQLLGLQHAGLLLPVDPRYGAPHDPTAVAARVPRHGRHAPCRRPGGGARRGLQPHARGRRTRPHAELRGLDNAAWYRLADDDRSRCENLTGCGNTLNVAHPRVTQFVLDSLRYWVQEMGVDGFRFDLAPVLGRTRHGFDAHAAFFTALRQDPVLARVHLIAEPWDAGRRLPGGPVSRPLSRVERQVPRQRAPLLAAARRAPGRPRRVRAALHRVSDLFQHGRVRPWPASTSSRCTTASRWPTWSATATSTTTPTARTTATAATTSPAPTFGEPRPRATMPHVRALRDPRAPRPDGHAAAGAGHADAAAPATNSATASAATTTPIARTTRRLAGLGAAEATSWPSSRAAGALRRAEPAAAPRALVRSPRVDASVNWLAPTGTSMHGTTGVRIAALRCLASTRPWRAPGAAAARLLLAFNPEPHRCPSPCRTGVGRWRWTPPAPRPPGPLPAVAPAGACARCGGAAQRHPVTDSYTKTHRMPDPVNSDRTATPNPT
jgi:hypothetical protein